MSAVMISVCAAATLAASLLAGLNLGSLFARRGIDTLQADVWISTHQAEDAVFRRIMPPIIITTIALSVVAGALASGHRRWFFATSALLVAFDMLLTVTRLVPLNRRIAGWVAAAPHVDWQTVRNDWSRLHGIRTGAATLAALLSTAALAGF
jgi:hypothetical protein